MIQEEYDLPFAQASGMQAPVGHGLVPGAVLSCQVSGNSS